MAVQIPKGNISVSLLGEKIIECRGSGHLRFEHVRAAQAEIERLLEKVVGTVDSLFDGIAVESFESGLPIRWIRWVLEYADRVDRVAVVAKPGPMMAVAKTFPYLMPALRVAIFTERRAAVAFLKSANDD